MMPGKSLEGKLKGNTWWNCRMIFSVFLRVEMKFLKNHKKISEKSHAKKNLGGMSDEFLDEISARTSEWNPLELYRKICVRNLEIFREGILGDMINIFIVLLKKQLKKTIKKSLREFLKETYVYFLM